MRARLLSKKDQLHNGSPVESSLDNYLRESKNATFTNDLNQPAWIGITVILNLELLDDHVSPDPSILEGYMLPFKSYKIPTEPTI